jgi:hypothetical protein
MKRSATMFTVSKRFASLFLLLFFSAIQAQELAPRPVLISSEFVNLVIFIPVAHADKLREALAKMGVGKIGNYDSCSFSVKGVARFRPLEAANPALGTLGGMEATDEERIEFICSRDSLPEVLREVKRIHPYEKIGYHVYNMQELR